MLLSNFFRTASAVIITGEERLESIGVRIATILLAASFGVARGASRKFAIGAEITASDYWSDW